MFHIIVAVDSKNGLGKNNKLAWHISGDLKYFQKITTKTVNPNLKNAVIMGRNTWESIPENRRPFKKRLNLVLTINENYKVPKGVVLAKSLDSALDILNDKNLNLENIFVIGGAKLYAEAITKCEKIYLTKINKEFDCDVFFPQIPNNFVEKERSEVFNENGIEYVFVTYFSLN
jgi:dihydrofolate reductase